MKQGQGEDQKGEGHGLCGSEILDECEMEWTTQITFRPDLVRLAKSARGRKD